MGRFPNGSNDASHPRSQNFYKTFTFYRTRFLSIAKDIEGSLVFACKMELTELTQAYMGTENLFMA